MVHCTDTTAQPASVDRKRRSLCLVG